MNQLSISKEIKEFQTLLFSTNATGCQWYIGSRQNPWISVRPHPPACITEYLFCNSAVSNNHLEDRFPILSHYQPTIRLMEANQTRKPVRNLFVLHCLFSSSFEIVDLSLSVFISSTIRLKKGRLLMSITGRRRYRLLPSVCWIPASRMRRVSSVVPCHPTNPAVNRLGFDIMPELLFIILRSSTHQFNNRASASTSLFLKWERIWFCRNNRNVLYCCCSIVLKSPSDDFSPKTLPHRL